MLFAGQDIDKSPFMVHVSKAMGDPTRVQARGPGLQATGNMANKPTYFDIYTAGELLLLCVRSCHVRLSANSSVLSVRVSTRSRRRRRVRHHCGFKQSQGYSGDCVGEQRRQYFPLHLRSSPRGSPHRLRDICWAADSQKPFHCSHL